MQELVTHKAASLPSPTGQGQKMSGKAFAVIMKPLIELHGEPTNWPGKVGIYFDALCDLPEHLLNTSVRHAIASNPYFPKPAELRGYIAAELSLYRRLREEARLAALPRLPEPPPPSPEDIAHVTEVMKQFRAAVAARTAVIGSE
jgi:hypothetical protein